MTTIQHSVTIERPVEEVWDYVMDIRNDPVWATSIVAVGRGAGEEPRVGLEFEETFKVLGVRLPLTFAITEHEPHRRSAVRIVRGLVPGHGRYEFERVAGGTRFTHTIETEPRGLLKLVDPVLGRVGRKESAASSAQLKQILEGS